MDDPFWQRDWEPFRKRSPAANEDNCGTTTAEPRQEGPECCGSGRAKSEGDGGDPSQPPPDIDDPAYHAAQEAGPTEDPELISEGSVAEAFISRHRDHLRYCYHSKSWFVWKGTQWLRDETNLAFDWAHQNAKEMAADTEKANVIIAAGKASFASGVERIAQSARAFAVTDAVWNADPWLLGTPGGTVDLKTGELRAARPDDYITKLTAVEPAVPGTPHPIWSNFLNEATKSGQDAREGDKDLQAFHQRLAGYFVTGDISEEVLAFFYGVGGTGKGTLIGTLISVLHDYAVHVPIEVFTAQSRINLEYYRAQMAGARLVTASETESGAAWAESQIKEMTGNEAPLSGRHPYGRPFTFRPQFKIGLVGNHAPKLKGRSPEMERRLRIAPFKHKPARPDKKLKQNLRAEFPAILRWIIDGCLEWQKNGLGTCKAVEAETDNYFAHQDSFGRWLSERCNLVATMSTKPGQLLTDFTAWAKQSGDATVNSTEFKELLERTPGIKYGITKGATLVRGIGLKAPEGSKDHFRDHGDDGYGGR